MTRKDTKMFGIDSVDDYLRVCELAVSELEADQDNVLRAFAAILALNHIIDWLQHKLTDVQRTSLGIFRSNVGDPVKGHFESQNSDIKRIRALLNFEWAMRPAG